jgi:hypothetical protein
VGAAQVQGLRDSSHAAVVGPQEPEHGHCALLQGKLQFDGFLNAFAWCNVIASADLCVYGNACLVREPLVVDTTGAIGRQDQKKKVEKKNSI